MSYMLLRTERDGKHGDQLHDEHSVFKFVLGLKFIRD